MSEQADAFGALVVAAIMSTGLNARTAESVSHRIVTMLQQGAAFQELYRVFSHADKIRSSLDAWGRRGELYASYQEASNKVKNLDDIRGIGRISAEVLVSRIEQQLRS